MTRDKAIELIEKYRMSAEDTISIRESIETCDMVELQSLRKAKNAIDRYIGEVDFDEWNDEINCLDDLVKFCAESPARLLRRQKSEGGVN